MDDDNPKVYIVLDNWGFPRFEGPDYDKMKVFLTETAALESAMDQADDNPNVVFTVYELKYRVVNDGLKVRRV